MEFLLAALKLVYYFLEVSHNLSTSVFKQCEVPLAPLNYLIAPLKINKSPFHVAIQDMLLPEAKNKAATLTLQLSWTGSFILLEYWWLSPLQLRADG